MAYVGQFDHRRDMAPAKEHLPSPAKRTKLDMYEERNQFTKPVYKESFNKTAIEKKPVLKSEWEALPQRKLAHKKTDVPYTHIFIANQEVKKSVKEATRVSEFLEQKLKQREAAKVAQTKAITPSAKGVAPAVKAAKEVKTAAEVKPAPKEVKPVAKEVKPVVKEVKPAVKEVKPVPKEVKPVVTEVKPAVKEVKPAAKEVTPAVKQTKPAVTESSNNDDKKDTKSKPTTEPNSEGQYELNEVLSNVLQDELQQIMIKVWQEIPGTLPTEAERAVADRIRNEAGDKLQNALGLAVTTRLLNVHNPLYCKLQFSCKPEPGCLESLVRKYKITAFKRIEVAHRDLFAARFDSIEDYDRLCVKEYVMCGSAKVLITPCYKYLSCPPSVKSIYSVNDKTKGTAKQIASNSPQKQANAKEGAEVKTNKVVYIRKNKKEPIENKTQANKTVTPVKKANSEIKTEDKTASLNTTTEAKAEKPKEAANVQTKPNNKIESADAEKKSNSDKSKNDVKTDDMTVVDEMDDDEEMTDQDILALMSGGIVLDECSGSDDEK